VKILIDIGHPAHVHYFRNFIRLMTEKGHEFCITARDKEVTFILLNSYKIPFTSRGKGGNGVAGKLLYLLKGDLRVWSAARKFKPDIFLSFASPYAAHAAFLMRKPHIALDDTEAAGLGQFFYLPFTETKLNPSSFKKTFKRNQIRFDSFMELSSLHTNYFKPDVKVLDELGINETEPFILLRFVSWGANHDFGQKGLSSEDKEVLINNLKKRFRILISSEKELPEDFKKYKIRIAPEKIHHVMAFASLFIGEGATMASECAMLGTPAIYVNSITAGTLEEQEKYGVLFGFRSSAGVLEKAFEILSVPNHKEAFSVRQKKILNEKIDITAFLIWFVENYPASLETMKTNNDFQYTFR
jgi:predicted glycosyltransferase